MVCRAPSWHLVRCLRDSGSSRSESILRMATSFCRGRPKTDRRRVTLATTGVAGRWGPTGTQVGELFCAWFSIVSENLWIPQDLKTLQNSCFSGLFHSIQKPLLGLRNLIDRLKTRRGWRINHGRKFFDDLRTLLVLTGERLESLRRRLSNWAIVILIRIHPAFLHNATPYLVMFEK